MVIYSWNMLFENQKLEEAFDFIKRTEFDIFCLQEVPEAFLERLQSLPYLIVKIQEVTLSTPLKTLSVYSVILSKYPVLRSQEISFIDPAQPVRTKLTRFILSFLRKERILKWEKRTSFFVDIDISSRHVRVFNLHLLLSSPSDRIKELKQAMEHKTDDMIICGDFNILEAFHISLLNWLLGGKISDWYRYPLERKVMEIYFDSLGLINPLQGKITHRLSRSQLDHILVPKSYNTQEAVVVEDTHGSDHNPIKVTLI